MPSKTSPAEGPLDGQKDTVDASGSSISYAVFTQHGQGSKHGTLKVATPHSSSGTKLTSFIAKLCPLWESTLGPLPDNLTEIFPQTVFVARGHLRGNQVEAAHALSSESVLKCRAGVMVEGDESSKAPARTCLEASS